MSRRGKRGVASGSKKYQKGEFTIEFDEDMQPVGENAAKFMSWLGMKCRIDFPFHIDTKKFEKQKWEDLWLETKEMWNIANDKPKSLVLKKAKKNCTNWRSHLVNKFVNVGETPFEKYTYLDHENWDDFVAEKTSAAFLAKSEKAKASALANKDFARVGRTGFTGLKPKFNTIWSQLVASYPYLENIQHERSRMWIVGRARRNLQTKWYEIGQDMHETANELARLEREMIEDGSYFQARADPLTRFLGPEHGGRSRTISDVIGPTMVHGGLFKGGRQQNQTNVPATQARSDAGVDASPGFRGSSCESGGPYTDYPDIETRKSMGKTKERAWRNTDPPKKKLKQTQKLPDDDGDVELLDPNREQCELVENTSPMLDSVEKLSSCQSGMICVQGYKVKQSSAPILEAIFKKHGDIAAECVFKTDSVRSSFLEVVCEVVRRIQTNDVIDKMEEIECQVTDAEAANINMSWIRAHFEAIHKRKEGSKKYNLLTEMKANTILVKRAAQMDLRERCAELVAAQQRFKMAETCVRVLHIVEKNLNDNILESKAKIDSQVNHPVV